MILVTILLQTGLESGDILRQYGLAGLVISVLAAAVVYLYKKREEDAVTFRKELKSAREDYVKALEGVASEAQARQDRREESRKSRDERFAELLRQQTGAIQGLSNALDRQSELQTILDRLGSGKHE